MVAHFVELPVPVPLFGVLFDKRAGITFGDALRKKGKRRNQEVHEIRKSEKSSIYSSNRYIPNWDFSAGQTDANA